MSLGRIPPQPPPTFPTSASAVLADMKRLIQASKDAQDQLVATLTADTATLENCIRPYEDAENVQATESRILCLLQYVSTNAEIRDAAAKAHTAFEDFEVQSRMRSDVFALVEAIYNDPAKAQDLDGESRYLLECIHRDFVRTGMKLDKDARKRLEEIHRRVNELTSTFTTNCVNASSSGIWLDTTELTGFPDNILKSLEKGTGDEEGKVLVPLDEHLMTITGFCTDAETRKRAIIAHRNRCNENMPIFQEVTVLRDEAARLLGYENHAAFSVQVKMARTRETVNDLLGDLRSGLLEQGRQELVGYRDLKKADIESRNEIWDRKFWFWDLNFYHRRLVKEHFQVDRNEIAEYFPLNTTLKGMLGIFEHLFGLDFECYYPEITETDRAPVWHDEVQVYSVWDDEEEGGAFLGYLYLDLYSRDFKRSQASCWSIVPGFTRPDGSRSYPSTALISSFTKPTATAPCLLLYNDLVELFHELGHGIHDLVSKTKYARFHGSAGTVVDFGEAPIQMLENWCKLPSQLRALSNHYSSLSVGYAEHWRKKDDARKNTKLPGVKTPEKMLNKYLESRNLTPALMQLNQLAIAIFDFDVHQAESREEMLDMDIATVYNKVQREVYPVDVPDDNWEHGYCEYRNLMSSDYHAGYYAYMLSNVYSADMFDTSFKDDPMNAAEGRRYRRVLLEKGGSRPEMEILEDYLGRMPSTKAFYTELGII